MDVEQRALDGKATLNDVYSLLVKMSDSEFAKAASGEFCEDLKAAIEGAIGRAIEAHDAYRQEVSDAVTKAIAAFDANGLHEPGPRTALSRFIIQPTDPLVEVLKAAGVSRQQREEVIADLKSRGLEIREVGE